LLQPGCFGNAVGNSPILSLGARSRDSGLPLGGPRDETAPEEDSIARGGASGVRAADPIRISIHNKLRWSRPRNNQTEAEGALKVPKDPLGSHKVNFPGIMHVKADLLDSIRNVGSSKCQVLECTCKAAVGSGISNRRTSICRNFGTGVNRSGARLAVAHPMASKNVQDVLTL
jgi:hypothetical protein